MEQASACRHGPGQRYSVQVTCAEELRHLDRTRRTEICRAALAATRARLIERHHLGSPGGETARLFSAEIDDVVRALHGAAIKPASPPLALVAVGGYGRAELCPGSDLDLWFVTDQPDHAGIAPLVEDVLYPLWDLKLAVGHAVRSPAEAVALARSDLTAATALLDIRLLAGEVDVWSRLEQAVRAWMIDRTPLELVRRLVEEQAARRQRFGDAVFLLEPDVKNGRGGYRDLLIARWAVRSCLRATDFPGLLAIGQATPRQVQALCAARNFLLRVRTAAHLHAGRRQDRLLFDVQETIAPELADSDARPAPRAEEDRRARLARTVETLMRSYYLHAKTVEREGGYLIARCLEERRRPPVTRRLPGDPSFMLWNGELATSDPAVLRERPETMIHLFRLALELGVDTYAHTRSLIADLVADPSLNVAARLATSPTAAREFTALLSDARDARSPSLLEQMHDLGLLAALMPDFAVCTAHAQHDLFHVYTVDLHQLYVVAQLKAIERGDLEAELPAASRAMRETRHRLSLYLAALLHDVAKPLGHRHAEAGARIAARNAARLGLAPAEVARVERLVAHHLLLAHLAQRRDLSDVAVIEHLARAVGDEETLRGLYLLTIADMSMVAPGTLTAWREQLLREIYVRTRAHLRRGPDLSGTDHSTTVARRRTRACRLAGEADDAFASWAQGLPDRYFAQTQPRQIVHHLKLSRHRPPGHPAVDARHFADKGWSELYVVADDVPGLLARIAGVLWAARINVLSSQIACRHTPGAAAEAIDTFVVRDRYRRALDDERVRQIAEDLARVAGGLPVEKLLEERRDASALAPRPLPAIATEVSIDTEASSDFTVIDIVTEDRPGVLYTITHTLSLLGLDIGLAKVSTDANRAADVFYVRDEHEAKLDAAAAERTRTALATALAALPLANTVA